MRCLFIAPFTLTLWLAGSALAGVVTGQVTGVLDGDTIEVLHYTSPERVRLSGIDYPEKGQAYRKHVALQLALTGVVSVCRGTQALLEPELGSVCKV